MGILAILMCQALDLASPRPEELPRMSLVEWEPQGRHPVEETFAVDAYALYTKWDEGLRMHDGWGFGGDLKIDLDWGSSFALAIKLGYLAWETDNIVSETFDAKSKIRQYRIGVGGDFDTEKIDFGIYVVTGLYHFHSVITDHTDPFFELQGSMMLKIVPHLKAGLTAMVDFVGTRYNRAARHLFTNASIGPTVEVSF
ncbi:MAG TPA: hypothetical protein VEN81_12400 [Planctomycetota bacterium]|nr:hypothetical protein [Planctomycetota bacterium]